MRPIQEAVPINVWNVAEPDSLTSLHMMWKSGCRCARVTLTRPTPLNSVASWMHTAVPRPITVETAAPATPSSGNGPTPNISSGSRIRLIVLAIHSTRMAMAASPAPLNPALIRKSSRMTPFAPSMIDA